MRHDKIAAAIHRELCQKHGFEYAEKSYNHHIDKESRVLENEEVKIVWDFTLHTEKKLEYNKPDIVILAKKEKAVYIVDGGCSFDTRIKERERTKIEKYTDLKYELPKVWKGEGTRVFILPIIKGALGTMTKNAQENLDKLKIDSIGMGSPEDRITRNVKNPEGGSGLVMEVLDHVRCSRYKTE